MNKQYCIVYNFFIVFIRNLVLKNAPLICHADKWEYDFVILIKLPFTYILDSSYKSYQKYKRKIEDASSHRACKAQKKGEQVSITDQVTTTGVIHAFTLSSIILFIVIPYPLCIFV